MAQPFRRVPHFPEDLLPWIMLALEGFQLPETVNGKRKKIFSKVNHSTTVKRMRRKRQKRGWNADAEVFVGIAIISSRFLWSHKVADCATTIILAECGKIPGKASSVKVEYGGSPVPENMFFFVDWEIQGRIEKNLQICINELFNYLISLRDYSQIKSFKINFFITQFYRTNLKTLSLWLIFFPRLLQNSILLTSITFIFCATNIIRSK